MSQIFHAKEGDVINMTAASDVAVDDFIDVNGNLGIALISGASGDEISVKLTGIIKAPKTAESLAFGDTVTANSAPTNNVVATGGDINGGGVVVKAAASGDATVLVRLPG